MVANQQAAGEVGSLKEATDLGYTFCLLQAISSSVYLRYPNLVAREVQNAGEVLNGLESGRCQAGFVTVDEWRKTINDHCDNLVMLGKGPATEPQTQLRPASASAPPPSPPLSPTARGPAP